MFALSARPTLAARPVAATRAVSARRVAAAPARALRASVVAKAEPKTPLEAAIEEAKDTCESGSSGECAVAWDTVEEISAAESHKKAQQAKADPLEEFCKDSPDADECRVYED